jgi:hypothetical protein
MTPRSIDRLYRIKRGYAIVIYAKLEGKGATRKASSLFI